MSYEIVKHKFVASFNEPSGKYTHHLFIVFWSSNNVSPRTYNGHMLARGCEFGADRKPGKWNDSITLPSELWRCAHAADGGSIKAYPKRELSGTGWIRSWKECAERPLRLDDENGKLIVAPSCSAWLPKDKAYTTETIPDFPHYRKAELEEAWNSLIRPKLSIAPSTSDYGHRHIEVRTTHDLTMFFTLMDWAKDQKDHSFFVGWTDYQAAQFEVLLQRSPLPEKPAKLSLSTGIPFELYGKKYITVRKEKTSWLATNTHTNQLTRVGPRHFRNIRILTEATA